MISYYADEQKYFINAKKPTIKSLVDTSAGQLVRVLGSTFGITIRPDKHWTPFCEKLFVKESANRICLEEISVAPHGHLDFVNDIPSCKSLAIESGKKVDLSPLAGNPFLEDLQLYSSAHYCNFDLSTLPNLQRCQIPVRAELDSFLKCSKLISLCISGGSGPGILDLRRLSILEEFVCINVGKLKGVVFHPKVRLRSLTLAKLRDFQSVEPWAAMTPELRVVEINKAPKMNLERLSEAEKVECIALRLGKIPTISFLKGLKRLQVLDLFGSMVQDGDLSLRDSLKGELSPELWSRHH